MADEYVTIEAKLKARTAKAVLLDVGTDVSRGAWVPRSCIHGADERKLDAAEIDGELSLRVFQWVAERGGLI